VIKGGQKRICSGRLGVLKATVLHEKIYGSKEEYEIESMLFWSL